MSVTQPAAASVELEIEAELDAWEKRDENDVAAENGYATWNEYQAACDRETKEAWQRWQEETPEERARKSKRWCVAPQVPEAEGRYDPEKCICTEHMREDFCAGNLQSPNGSMVGMGADMDKGLLPNLEEMEIDEQEPSKRLSSPDLYCMWFRDSDVDYQPQHFAPWLKQDKLIQHLQNQPTPRRNTRRFAGSGLHTCTGEPYPTFQSDVTIPSHQNQKRRLTLWPRNKPRLDRADKTTNSYSPLPSQRSVVQISNDGPQSTSQPDSAISSTQSKKRKWDTLDALDVLDVEDVEEVEKVDRNKKRRKVNLGASGKLRMNIADDHHGQEQPFDSQFQMDIDDYPGDSSYNQLVSMSDDLDEVQQLELEADTKARQAEQVNRRLELARRRKLERTKRSQSYKGVAAPRIQEVVIVPPPIPQADPTPSPSQVFANLQSKHSAKANKGAKGSIERGSKKTVPAINLVRVTRIASSIQKTKAKDKKGIALPWLPSFLEQPRLTRSKDSRVFGELGEQGRGLTHPPRRSQRIGRSW